jgi:hypothetical protein
MNGHPLYVRPRFSGPSLSPSGSPRVITGNSRRPELTQTNLVDIYLFRADSKEQILHRRNYPNPFMEAGAYPAQINDTWFGADGLSWSGRNTSFPYYWVITRSDKGLDGTEQSQPIFSAIREYFSIFTFSLSTPPPSPPFLRGSPYPF